MANTKVIYDGAGLRHEVSVGRFDELISRFGYTKTEPKVADVPTEPPAEPVDDKTKEK